MFYTDFLYFFHFIGVEWFTEVKFAVKVGKYDNFEDIFTICDKNEDTPLSLVKLGLILILYIFFQFFGVVWFILYKICRQGRKMWQFWGYLYKMWQKWGYTRTLGKIMFNIDFLYIFSILKCSMIHLLQ